MACVLVKRERFAIHAIRGALDAQKGKGQVAAKLGIPPGTFQIRVYNSNIGAFETAASKSKERHRRDAWKPAMDVIEEEILARVKTHEQKICVRKRTSFVEQTRIMRKWTS